ncbi:hypothetical protein K438DRAFT_1975557 [Mycena galopus ATCC 62051]|nr:hypothetical protein K438DRAFT_1975557 [Mycena galopus ATCC 62051]
MYIPSRTPTVAAVAAVDVPLQLQKCICTLRGIFPTYINLSNLRSRDASTDVPTATADGTIVLFVIMILALAVAAGATVIWIYRRFKSRTSPEPAVQSIPRKKFALPTVSPFDLVEAFRRSGYTPDTSAVRISTASTARQQQLEDELRAVQEKMVDLEDLERRADPVANSDHILSRGPQQLLRLLSIGSTVNKTASGGTQDLVSQLEAARERNEALAARIRDLEAQMQSEWALGLSDDPPPVWGIFHGVLATPEIVPSSWRKPNVTLSSAERVALTSAALQRSISELPTTTGSRSTVYYQMADFDALTNQTTYANVLQQFLNGTAQSQEEATDSEVRAKTSIYLRLSRLRPGDLGSTGHAAVRAYQAYNKNPVFLALANQSWAFALSYTISRTNLASGSISGKDFTLKPTCGGAQMLGGTLDTTNSADTNISGFASPYFLGLSAFLAEATSDPTYLNAAWNSVDFITTQLFNQSLVMSGISADNCTLNNARDSFDSGAMIEGLAVLYSITNNASTQALLNDLISATISNDNWVTAEGIIAQGKSNLGDKDVVRGLAEAYTRNALSPDLRDIVEAFIGVQFNAVTDLATENGTAIYAGAWTGPPSTIFLQSNQSTAISALLAGTALDSSNLAPSPPLSPSAVPSSSTGRARQTPVAAIAGGVVGGVVLVAFGIAVCFIRRRRSQLQAMQATSFSDMTSMTPIAASTFAKFTTNSHMTSPARSTFPDSPILPRNSVAKVDLPVPQRRHCVNDQPAESDVDLDIDRPPTSVGAPPVLPSSSVVTQSPAELPTTELVRLLNERLQGREWDEAEVPPEYGSDR